MIKHLHIIMSSISVVVHDQTSKSETDGKLSHLLSGSVSQNVIESVLKMCSSLDEFSQHGENRRRLRALWYQNLDSIGGVPLPIAFTSQNSEISSVITNNRVFSHRRITERVEPVVTVQGCSGRPAAIMVKPELNTSKIHNKVFFDYVPKKNVPTVIRNPSQSTHMSEDSSTSPPSSEPSSEKSKLCEPIGNVIANPLPLQGSVIYINRCNNPTDNLSMAYECRVAGRVIQYISVPKKIRRNAKVWNLFRRHDRSLDEITFGIRVRLHDGEELSLPWPCEQVPSSFTRMDVGTGIGNIETSMVGEDIVGIQSALEAPVAGSDSASERINRLQPAVDNWMGDEGDSEADDADMRSRQADAADRPPVEDYLLSLERVSHPAVNQGGSVEGESDNIQVSHESRPGEADEAELIRLSGSHDLLYSSLSNIDLGGSAYENPSTSAAALAEVNAYFESLTSREIRFQIHGNCCGEGMAAQIRDEIPILPADDPSVPLPDPTGYIIARCNQVRRQQLLWTFHLQDIYMRIDGEDSVVRNGTFYIDPTSVIAPEQFRPSAGRSSACASSAKPLSRKRTRLGSSLVDEQRSKL